MARLAGLSRYLKMLACSCCNPRTRTWSRSSSQCAVRELSDSFSNLGAFSDLSEGSDLIPRTGAELSLMIVEESLSSCPCAAAALLVRQTRAEPGRAQQFFRSS